MPKPGEKEEEKKLKYRSFKKESGNCISKEKNDASVPQIYTGAQNVRQTGQLSTMYRTGL